jgi:hypothetical protein
MLILGNPLYNHQTQTEANLKILFISYLRSFRYGTPWYHCSNDFGKGDSMSYHHSMSAESVGVNRLSLYTINGKHNKVKLLISA